MRFLRRITVHQCFKRGLTGSSTVKLLFSFINIFSCIGKGFKLEAKTLVMMIMMIMMMMNKSKFIDEH